jgi:hypothetical protein
VDLPDPGAPATTQIAALSPEPAATGTMKA